MLPFVITNSCQVFPIRPTATLQMTDSDIWVNGWGLGKGWSRIGEEDRRMLCEF